MKNISNAYINALLADATYALNDNNINGLTGSSLEALSGFAERMTSTLAKYIGENFTVVNHIETSDVSASGFDATVWREKASGKIYVSLQGTAGFQDFLTDATLTLNGNAGQQVIDMVNWWLKITTPVGQMARQIGNTVDAVSGFVSVASDVPGTGLVSAADLAQGIEINGHSLGGYLATAFTRLFGSEAHVEHTSTFNSAGFALGSEAVFASLQNLLGSDLGLARFPNGTEQTNYFAANGLNVTTNSFYFNQQGQRVEVSNESDATQLGNHYMYKLTDALALGAALEKLDPTLTVSDLNALLRAGANQTQGSIEGVLDSLRRALAGPGVEPLPIGDVSGSAPSRVTYHATLAALQDNPIFKGLVGQLHIEPASHSLAALARSDFGALIALQDLSPFYIGGTTAAANDQLAANWQISRAADYTAWQTDKLASTPATFTNSWLTDRATLLQAVVARNDKDGDGIAYSNVFPTDRAYDLRWTDAAGTAQILVGENTARQGGVLQPVATQMLAFGGSGADNFTGYDNTRGDHLYGGAGNDTLDGRGGNDYLEGNSGDDVLIGGAGNDTLVGGAGTDTYRFDGDFGSDTVIDSDGAGRIVVGSGASPLTGGKKLADNTWQSDDKRVLYTLSGTDLIIAPRSATANSSGSGSITVRNWKPGDLGLTLEGAAPAADVPAPSTAYDLGTAAGLDAYIHDRPWQNADSLQLHNVATPRDMGAPGEPMLRSSGASGGRGDDVIEGGAVPAATNIILTGRTGDDRLYATTFASLQDAIARGDDPQTHALTTSRMVLDGGDGDDLLVGGDGRDVLFGGQGDDTIVGGAGEDVIFADGNAGGLSVGAGYEGGAAPLVVNGLSTAFGDPSVIGSGTMLRVDHEGIDLGLGRKDATGRQTRTIESPASRMLSVMSTTDYSAVAALDGYVGDKEAGGLTTNRSSGNDTIYAGAGDDAVNAGAGDDIVLAGSGNDTVVGYDGNDYIAGGSGNDVLFGDAPSSGIDVGDPSEQVTEFHAANIVTRYGLDIAKHGEDIIDGGDGSDYIEGGGRSDVLMGGAGNDTIMGDDATATIGGAAAGDDFIDGGSGDDTMFGGAGSDTIRGGSGKDTLVGDWKNDDNNGAGADTLDGGDGADILWGGGGDDILQGGAGDDVLRGDTTVSASKTVMSFAYDPNSTESSSAPGNDYLDGGDGNDRLYGEAGDDRLFGGSGDDNLEGGDGNDALNGGNGDDQLLGGAGNDILEGGSGADVLSGGLGNDTYIEGSSDIAMETDQNGVLRADTIIDTEGDNTLVMSGTTLENLAVTNVTLNSGISSLVIYDTANNLDQNGKAKNAVTIKDGAISRTISQVEADGQKTDFESFIGSKLQDVVHLDSSKDGQYLMGGARADTIAILNNGITAVAGQGNDNIVLGGSENTIKIKRGDGNDVISGAPGKHASDNTILWGTGIGLSDLTITRAEEGAFCIALADGGASVKITGGGIRKLQFSDNDSTVDLENMVRSKIAPAATAGNDWMEGLIFDDTMAGGAGNDVIFGFDGDDTLMGDDGDDFLMGGAGNDTLTGGRGFDNLQGGDGDDILVSDSADYLNGGAGNDAYRITFDASATSHAGLISDGLGQNRIQITNGPDNIGDYAVFNEDGLVFLAAGKQGIIQLDANVQFSAWTLVTPSGQEVHLSDVISRQNALGIIDAGSWSRDKGVVWTGLSGSGHTLVGTDGDDYLQGDDGDDKLFGLGGNDRLYGGAGRDILAGGTGNNSYEFRPGSGVDTIQPTAGETGIIQINGKPASAITGSVVNGDFHIDMGGGDEVYISGAAENKSDFADWKVVIDGKARNLLDFVTSTPASASLQARKNAFMSAQYVQLATQPQMGNENPPVFVQQKTFQVPNGHLDFGSYLTRTTTSTSISTQFLDPIYDEKPSTSGYEFVPSSYNEIKNYTSWFSMPGIPVYIDGPPAARDRSMNKSQNQLVGFLVKTDKPAERHLVGWNPRTEIRTEVSNSDSVLQSIVTGSSSTDVVESSAHEQFRGVIETGEGDDRVVIGWPDSRTRDTTKIRDNSIYGYSDFPEGAGAWIDTGDGDDVIKGSDGDDVIIGGAGSDTIEGGAGADTYIISAPQPGDLDIIHDTALTESMLIESYGGLMNQDVIEFDETIHLQNLSYRWTETGSNFDKTLELLYENKVFLDIDYQRNPDYLVGMGVERFKFSNGLVLDLDGLIAALPEAAAANPDGDPYGHPHGTFMLDSSVDLSSLSYQWISPDDSGVAKLALFKNGEFLVEFDYEGSVEEKSRVQSMGGIDYFEFSDGNGFKLQDLLSVLPVQTARSPENLYLTGTAGDDTLKGGDGNDLLDGGAGNDTLSGGLGHNTYLFGRGDEQDRITFLYDTAADKRNTLQLKAGIASADVALRRDGANLVVSIAGTTDQITVENFLYLDDAANVWNPVQQIRFADGATWDTVTIQSRLQAATEGDDIVHGTQGDDLLSAGGGDDQLYGAAGNDRLEGGNGDDALYGEAGNDTLDGGPGSDTLSGGIGNNTYLFGRGDGQDRLTFLYDTAADKLNTLQFKAGVAQEDVRLRRDGANLVVSIAGTTDQMTVENFLYLDEASNMWNPLQQIRFDDGTVLDIAAIEARLFAGTDANDVLRGTVGNDTLSGGLGDDVLNGAAGADKLLGGAGDDSLYGEGGNDVLQGGQGKDVLYGGEGNNTYVFGRGDGQDRLTFFYDTAVGKRNTLQLEAGVASSDLVLHREGDNLIVAIAGTTDQVTVENFLYMNDASNAWNPLQQIAFADGTVWGLADIQAKLDTPQQTSGTTQLRAAASPDITASNALVHDTSFVIATLMPYQEDTVWAGAAPQPYPASSSTALLIEAMAAFNPAPAADTAGMPYLEKMPYPPLAASAYLT
ncbi:calcium-binding protein [Sphingomonas sp. NCPPB 2930]